MTDQTWNSLIFSMVTCPHKTNQNEYGQPLNMSEKMNMKAICRLYHGDFTLDHHFQAFQAHWVYFITKISSIETPAIAFPNA